MFLTKPGAGFSRVKKETITDILQFDAAKGEGWKLRVKEVACIFYTACAPLSYWLPNSIVYFRRFPTAYSRMTFPSFKTAQRFT